MNLKGNERTAMANAIYNHLHGVRSIERRDPAYADTLEALADRILSNEESKSDLVALSFVASLPYSHPEMGDENESDSYDFPAFCTALYKLSWSRMTQAEALDNILTLIGK